MLLYFVLSCFVAIFVKCQDSPSCSQFYYVDSLLEKMIRMEIKVEALERQITDTNAEAQTALAELRLLREAFGNETEQLEQQRIEFEMLQLNVQHQLTAEIETAKDSLVIPNVLFKARTAKDLSLEAGQAIIFTDTMFNYGGGYDNITGIFTAPVNGVYFFNFHICVYTAKSLHYGIVLNGVVKTSGRFYDADAAQCYSINEMLPMHAGHKVWIKCVYSTSTLYEYSTTTQNYWNMFNGMLVHT